MRGCKGFGGPLVGLSRVLTLHLIELESRVGPLPFVGRAPTLASSATLWQARGDTCREHFAIEHTGVGSCHTFCYALHWTNGFREEVGRSAAVATAPRSSSRTPCRRPQHEAVSRSAATRSRIPSLVLSLEPKHLLQVQPPRHRSARLRRSIDQRLLHRIRKGPPSSQTRRSAPGYSNTLLRVEDALSGLSILRDGGHVPVPVIANILELAPCRRSTSDASE